MRCLLPSRSANFGERLQLQHWYASAVTKERPSPSILAIHRCLCQRPGGRLTRYDRSVPCIRDHQRDGRRTRRLYRFAGTCRRSSISPLDPDRILQHLERRSSFEATAARALSIISPSHRRRREPSGTPGAGAARRRRRSWPTHHGVRRIASSEKGGVLGRHATTAIVQIRDKSAARGRTSRRRTCRVGVVDGIEPSPHDPRRAFLAVSAYRTDDFRPYIYRTDDHGQTWTLLTTGNGIPASTFIRVVARIRCARAALCRRRVRHVRLADDGRAVAVAAAEPARHAGHRPRRAPGRPRPVDQWAIVLDPGRRDAASRAGGAARSTAHLFPPRDTYRLPTSAEEADDAVSVRRLLCLQRARPLYAGARIERHELGEEPPEGAISTRGFPESRPSRSRLSILGTDGARRSGRSSIPTKREDGRPARGRPESLQLGLRDDSLGGWTTGGAPGPRVAAGVTKARLTAERRV